MATNPAGPQNPTTPVTAGPTLCNVTALNALYYGDNLSVLQQHIATESVDLIYLDPPFNSNRSYNVLFKSKAGDDSQAQIEAFDDTWHWSQQTEALYTSLVAGGAPIRASEAIEAMHKLVGPNDVLAYLVMMTARLIELHRVLKPTGSLYLHCDPTASHYLKVLLDAIFGPTNFRNEIVWQRVAAKGGQMGRLPANHDIIFDYCKTAAATWNELRLPYDLDAPDAKTLTKYSYVDENGRRYRHGPLLHPEQGKRPNLEYELMGVRRTWRWSKERMDEAVAAGRIIQTAPGKVPQQKMYLDEQPGRLVGDVWTDIGVLNSQAAERLGYPTQKPLLLLERIILASSNEGDVVLDPFCGCGTTVDAAQKLRRHWVGIDITYLAVDLIRKRLRHGYGPDIETTYEVHGIPTDVPGAEALFEENPFDFERWAVSLVNAQPNEKQVGDKGVDGRIRFHADKDKFGMIVVSVKGGKHPTPSMMYELSGAVEHHKAEMGLLILLQSPTKGMKDVAAHSGTYTVPLNSNAYPKLQITTVAELLGGQGPHLPPAIAPYIQAVPKPDSEAVPLF